VKLVPQSDMLVVLQQMWTDLGAESRIVVICYELPSGCQSDAMPNLTQECGVGVGSLHVIAWHNFQIIFVFKMDKRRTLIQSPSSLGSASPSHDTRS
jgi:hypothetical protein